MEKDVGRLEAKSKEPNKDKKRLRKKLDYTRQELDHTRQELDQTNERLANSRDEYTVIEKELKRVREELVSTQAQLDTRSMFGSTSHKQEKLLEEERAQQLKLLDRLREVNKKNLNLQKQLAGGMASNVANVANPVASYRPRGIGPKSQLTGTDPTAYALWRWAVNDKLRVDAVIYPEEKDWISYAFHQLAQPIFQQLDAWINANADDILMEDFYKQMEHSMRIHMLVKKAEDELHVVTMRPTETVNDYYQRIFKLWEQARTTKREKVKRFEITLKPSISHALIGQKHTKIMDVLDAAREIEHRKSQMSSKFARDLAKPFQKTLGSSGSLGRTWGKERSLPQASASSSARANSAASEASKSFSAAPRNNGKSVNTTSSSSANLNAKFIPTSTKPAGWVGTWYNPETYPQKLQDDKGTTLLQQGRCWGCRGSGHRGSNECCPLTNKKTGLNVTTACAVEVSDSELEKA